MATRITARRNRRGCREEGHQERPSQRLSAHRQVRISAPLRMDLDTIRVFAIAKLGWIRQQQKRSGTGTRNAPRIPGPRKPLRVGQALPAKGDRERRCPAVELKHSQILLQIRPGTDEEKKQAILDEWYRAQLKLPCHR